MGKVRYFDRWISRIADGIAIYPLVPAGIFALIGGYLSTGVSWINALGAFGWFGAGLVTFFLFAAANALLAKGKLLRVEAAARARLNSDSSPFDPMARVYEGKRIYLRDLAPFGRREVIDKRFINCEIIGPGTVIIGIRSNENKPFPTMKDSQTFDVDVVEFDPDSRSALAITMLDCDFDSCRFYHMTMLFLRRENQTLNWITPDFNQPRLIEDNSSARQD